MHWLALTAIGALANACFVLLWKQASGRPDIMVMIALNNILAGALVIPYTVGWQQVKFSFDQSGLALLGGLVFTNLFIIVFFSLALKAGPVSYVNPVFSGILNVSMVLMALALLGEKISLVGGLGIAAVLVGATMIAIGA